MVFGGLAAFRSAPRTAIKFSLPTRFGFYGFDDAEGFEACRGAVVPA